jgi:hypothetical protein
MGAFVPFLIKTDHFSLKFLLDQRLATIPQHQWASKLIDFDFHVEFQPGTGNVVVDALSRHDTEITTDLAAISTASFTVLDELHQEHATDPALQAVMKQVLDGERGEHWRIIDNQITAHGKVYVPPESPTMASLLAHAHGYGHEGTEKMLHRLRGDFRVPGARALVRDFMRACTTCQRNKTDQLQPASLLQLLPVSSTVWVDIRIDFIEGLLKVNGRSVILTVVDRLSKSAHFLPLGHPYTATTIARVFFDNIVKLHDVPSSIVSDRDPAFTGRFWQELFKLAGVNL